MAYTRIHRLLRLLVLVQSGEHRAADLARLCGTSPRNVYRDLKEMAAAGVPVGFDASRGCYRLDPGRFLPPMQLTIEESLALALLGEQLGDESSFPYSTEASQALDKVVSQLPATLRDRLQEERRRQVVRTAPGEPAEQYRDVYERMREALRERRTLAVAYDSARRRGEVSKFHLEPYALFFSVRSWYVVGRHADAEEVRNLKLSRFASIRPLARRYRIPRDFSLDGHLGNAWRMIRGPRDHRVVLDFDPAFAPTVTDTIWHRTQQVEHRRDGSCRMTFTVSGGDEIVWWILSMGPHCKVVKPRSLADRVRTLAARTARRYRSS